MKGGKRKRSGWEIDKKRNGTTTIASAEEERKRRREGELRVVLGVAAVESEI